jgi:hypothetical protein
MHTYQPNLADLQQAILSPESASPTTQALLLRPHPRLSAAQQLAIYQAGYQLRLSHAVQSDYPATAHYLGQAPMQRCVAAYVQATPSPFYNLDFYSAGFAAWLAGTVAAPAAVALAAFEAALTRSFLQQDATPVTQAVFMALTPEAFGAARLTLQQSVHLYRSDYAVAAYFAAWKQETATIATLAAPLPAPLYLRLYRAHYTIQHTAMTAAEFYLLQRLQQGATIIQALAAAGAQAAVSEAYLAEHIGGWLACWLQQGLITALLADDEYQRLS